MTTNLNSRTAAINSLVPVEPRSVENFSTKLSVLSTVSTLTVF